MPGAVDSRLVLAHDQTIVLNLASDAEGSVAIDRLDSLNLNTALEDSRPLITCWIMRREFDGADEGFPWCQWNVGMEIEPIATEVLGETLNRFARPILEDQHRTVDAGPEARTALQADS